MADFSLSGGVRILGYISPFDTNDTYAVIDPLYGVDGLRNVNNLSQLTAITTERRRAGMVVGVDNTTGTTYYTLKNSPWNNTLSDWFETHTVSDNLITFPSTIDAQTYLSGGTNLIDIIKNDGDIVDGQNVGSGTGIFKDKSGTTLNFRTLTGVAPSNKITTAVSGDTVQLDIDEPKMTLWPLVVTGNKLISGNVTFVSGLTFDVSALEYIIGSTVYNASPSQVTLSSGDTTYDRIDVIFADISGNTGVVEGTPTANPSKPNVNTATQVEVTFVTVPAGSSTPDISITKIYDENLGSGGGEWDYSATTAVRISGDSTADAFSGTKSVEFISAATSDSFTMTIPTPYDLSNDNILTFYLKNKDVWNGNQIDISLLDSGDTINGGAVTLQDSVFGFDGSNISAWQIISIDLATFSLSNNLVSKVRFEVNSPTDPLSAYIDLIRFQSGAATASPQNIWYSIIGDDNNTTDATSPTDQLRLSGGTNIETSVSNKTVIFDITSGISATYIGDGTVSNTEYQYLSGVTSNIQNQIDQSVGTFVTGGSYVNGGSVYDSNSVDLDFNTGGTVTITNVRDTYVTGQTFNDGNYTLTTTLNDGSSENTNLSILSTDMVVTGGTYNINNGIVTFTNNSGGTFDVSGFTSGMTDSFTTDANLSGDSITFDSNLNGVNYYNVDLTPLLSGKTDNTTFSAYTSTTLTTLNGKVDSGLNVGDGEGVFRDKTGTTLNFKTIKSTGSTVDITNLGDEINLEVTHTTDTNGMFDSDNQGGTWAVSAFTLGDDTTITNGGNNIEHTGTGGIFSTNQTASYSYGASLSSQYKMYLVSSTHDRVLNIVQNNTDASGPRSGIDVSSTVTKTGSAGITGVKSSITGTHTGGTNTAAFFEATNGNVNNALLVPANGGYAGFGTQFPSANVQIGESANAGTFKYVDGNQAADRILRADTNGNATWVDIGSIPGVTADTNTFVTGYTYTPSANTFTINMNNGSAYTSTITSVSGLTTTGTIESGTFTSGGTNLDQLFTQDAFKTISVNGQSDVVADQIHDTLTLSGINIDIITTPGSDTITFSADTETGEINDATNVGLGAGIYRDKTGTTINLKSIRSSGSTVIITNNDDEVNLEVAHIPDTNDYVTGTTKEGNAAVVRRDDGSNVFTLSGGSNVSIVSGGTNLMRVDVSIPADTNTFVTGGTLTSGGTLVLEKSNDVDVDPIDFTETKRHVITADQALAISAGRSYLGTTGVSLLSFIDSPSSSDDDASFNFSVPGNYISGGTFYLKITSLAAAVPPNNMIQYEMNITSIDLNGDLSTATDTGLQNVTSASTTSWELVESPEYIPLSSTFSVNKHVSVRINRDVSDAPDTHSGTAYVWGLVFEYTGIR